LGGGHAIHAADHHAAIKIINATMIAGALMPGIEVLRN
jgi:hypothetical protein